MEIVSGPAAVSVLRERGGLYVWARQVRCCGGRQHVLEASTERPAGAFDLVHTGDGYGVWATPGLRIPHSLHVELDRKGRIRAFWNGQSWIG